MSMARSNAFVPVGFGGPENPTFASLSCTSRNGLTASPFCRRNDRVIAEAVPPPAIPGAIVMSAPTPRDTPETRKNLRLSIGSIVNLLRFDDGTGQTRIPSRANQRVTKRSHLLLDHRPDPHRGRRVRILLRRHRDRLVQRSRFRASA